MSAAFETHGNSYSEANSEKRCFGAPDCVSFVGMCMTSIDAGGLLQ